MRPYATVSPLFWTGSTGKRLRSRPDSQRIAFYLMTCPHSHQSGIYYLPMMYLCHEVGVDLTAATSALEHLSTEKFCSYDPVSEWIWVREMAAWQIGSELSELDKRCKGMHQYLTTLPELPFLADFVARYASDFHIRARPLQGASGGASSEQLGSGSGTGTGKEQEQEGSAATPTCKTSEPKKRASKRCPTDFEVTSDLREWAGKKFPGVDLDRETAMFRDHEYKDPKSDWPAAWRTWITKATEWGKPTTISTPRARRVFPS